jgi:hypothetical protein
LFHVIHLFDAMNGFFGPAGICRAALFLGAIY